MRITKIEKLKQNKDTYLTKYVFKQIELIKSILGITKNSRVYFIGYSREFYYFSYKNKVFVSSWNCNKNEKKTYLIETMNITDLYVITLHKDYPKTEDDIMFEVIKREANTYTESDFLYWIDRPSRINKNIDLPYYKIIKFLQGYNLKKFKTKNYLFYSKKDNEYCYTLNIYAKDLKNNAEVKLYIPDKTIQTKNGEWVNIPPQSLNDFVVEDKSGKLSKYQIRKCKKEFLKFASEYSDELGVKNFYVLELIKQTIQPVQYECGWAVHRIFAGDKKFVNIWVSDFMLKNEEPYFIITDNNKSWKTTKVATLDFKTAKYHNDGIYKQGVVKFKKWELGESYIKELIEFLKSPCSAEYDVYKKYVKTNWQQMIFEYNHNTAEWGWEENGFDTPPNIDLGQLPFDLLIPNYMALVKK